MAGRENIVRKRRGGEWRGGSEAVGFVSRLPGLAQFWGFCTHVNPLGPRLQPRSTSPRKSSMVSPHA